MATSLSSLVGTGREFLPSELPTYRDVLRYGVLLKERSEIDACHYPPIKIAKDIIPALLSQWIKANAEFKAPVIIHETTLVKKIKNILEQGMEVARGRVKLAKKQAFIDKLDKLLDILNCKCTIQLCVELGCVKKGDSRCRMDAHADCTCTKEFKIPVLELAFIKAQREKEGSTGAMQMAGVDTPETIRQIEALENKETKTEAEKKSQEKRDIKDQKTARADQEAREFMSKGDEENNEVNRDTEYNLVPPPESQTVSIKKKYNTMDIPTVALASMRHHTGMRETAEIATAALIDAGVVTEDDTNLVIDHSKVKRAQERLAKELESKFDEKIKRDGVDCLLFDGRQDDTKAMLECEDSDRQFPGLVREEHYSVCQEPGGKYLFHFVPDEATTTKKHAEIIADTIVQWLVEKKQDKVLMAIGGDSTNVNTGWQGGAMYWVENKLGRRLVWIVCDLHTGELPLRKLMIQLDGPTKSYNKWEGPIGEMLDIATDLEINPRFKKVDIGPPPIQLRQEVINDLSTDQYYAYKITGAIRAGVVSTTLANLQIGPINHSRWLTMANRTCRLYISKHCLSKKNSQNLKLIVEYIVGVYIPNWFNIKVKHSWEEGANHVLYQLELLRLQSKKTLDIVMPTVRRGAWYAHAESVLQGMLCSQVEEERKFAVDKIVELRGEGDEETQKGDNSVRYRKTPNINEKATKLAELIDWTEGATEPPLTCSLTTQEVRGFIATPMKVPAWPSHTQSVERLVKRVTEASAHVFSHERRDGFIRSQEASSELMPRNRSKQDLMNFIKFRNIGFQ